MTNNNKEKIIEILEAMKKVADNVISPEELRILLYEYRKKLNKAIKAIGKN